MEDWLRNYIKTNALNGVSMKLGNNLPSVKMPSIKDVGEDIFPYLFLFTKYIDLYDELKDDMYFEIVASENNILDFTILLRYFTDISNLTYRNSTFVYDKDTYITFDNISLFMQVIKVIHHRDKKSDYYKHSNSLVDKMLERARKHKKEIAERKAKLNVDKDDDIGFSEITSTISARHPSINLLNIKELNYYQIIDQYKRLIQIDKYNPVLVGNATEEYVKDLKHYSSKLVNDD